MEQLLKGLLGKIRKPIVFNGSLIIKDRKMLTACLDGYKVAYYYQGRSVVSVEPKGDEILKAHLETFNTKYGKMFNREEVDLCYVEAQVDPFTGAIVLQSPAYTSMLCEELHDPKLQYTQEDMCTIRDFVIEMTENYFNIYMYLLNRRLLTAYTPYYVRGHLVSGLYQPLLVETSLIKSPFLFPENYWLRDLFKSHEKLLEHTGDSARHLKLSCVAMCDISEALGSGIVRNMDRRHFMFIMCLLLLSKLDADAVLYLRKTYSGLLDKITSSQEEVVFLGNILEKVNNLKTN